MATKHEVIGLMLTAALESAERKIRVHPGPVNNDMMRRIEKDMNPENSDEVMKGSEAAVPFSRYAEFIEIADMALFRASALLVVSTLCMGVY